MLAYSVSRDLRRLGTRKKAKASAWFFKTGKEQYGYGDIFFGVTVPEQRQIAKRYATLPLKEIKKLLKSKVHECRFTALLVLSNQYEKGNTVEREKIFNFYIKNINNVNSWDLVDSSAPYILGYHLLNKSRQILYKFSQSEDLWERRIAIIATYAFIKRNDYRDTLRISNLLFKDKHDLIHKAVGWMLREVGNRSLVTEEKFLKKYASIMPRTALRYAIEKFPKQKRKQYLAAFSTPKVKKKTEGDDGRVRKEI